MARPRLEFGEAYSSRRLEVEGDLLELLMAVYRSMAQGRRPAGLAQRTLWKLDHWLHANTPAGSKRNIHHHYDIGNDFYKLWLDEQLLYTCAYFPTPTASLEEAQRAKMDHVARKVWLKPGERVAEAGCGWGSLALHLARHYGVSVRAFNISHEQIVYARARAKVEGLDGRVEFVEDDYRNMSGHYDVFVSVGMLEHVGRDHYRDLVRTIDRVLGPAGRGLIHSIGQNVAGVPLNPWIRRRIFPGAYPPSLREMAAMFEPWLVLRARRGEPPPALRRDAAPLAGPLQRRRGPGGADVRSGLRPRMAALPDRVAGRLPLRQPPVVPARLRPPPIQCDSLDAGLPLPVARYSSRSARGIASRGA